MYNRSPWGEFFSLVDATGITMWLRWFTFGNYQPTVKMNKNMVQKPIFLISVQSMSDVLKSQRNRYASFEKAFFEVSGIDITWILYRSSWWCRDEMALLQRKRLRRSKSWFGSPMLFIPVIFLVPLKSVCCHGGHTITMLPAKILLIHLFHFLSPKLLLNMLPIDDASSVHFGCGLIKFSEQKLSQTSPACSAFFSQTESLHSMIY